jgi:large subunit ribosomal protein L13
MVTKKSAPTEKASKKAPETTAAKKAKKAQSASLKIAAKTTVRDTRSIRRKDRKPAGKAAKGTRVKAKAIGRAPHSARITEAKGPMRPIASRTQFVAKYDEDRKWLLIDANGLTLGRLASEIANLLRGKHKPTFTPNNDAGDFVIVINTEKVVLSGKKEEQKQYHWHSGYIGGLKTTTPQRLRKTDPSRIIFTAVKGMVPRSPLGRNQMRKLKLYAGDKHPHVAQAPVAWNLRNTSNA